VEVGPLECLFSVKLLYSCNEVGLGCSVVTSLHIIQYVKCSTIKRTLIVGFSLEN
jgi:hypothetical protein